MDKDRLINVLVGALDKAGRALAVAERETKDAKKAMQYAKAMRLASFAILKARQRG